MSAFTIGYRLVFGLFGLAAVSYSFWDSVVDGTGSPVNFFSFFTILSNIAAFVVLLAGVYPSALTRAPAWQYLRGAVTVYMVITGVVYNVLLAPYAASLNVPSWTNDAEHKILPVAVLLEWLLFPPARRIAVPKAMWWLVFPVIYLIYSEVRGPFAHWYPYPFLDPRDHGVWHVVLNTVGVAAGFVLVTVGVAWAGTYLGRRRAQATL